MTLDQLRPGSSCTITGLSAANILGQRLLDMGIFPGLSLRVIRNAPLEDPCRWNRGIFHQLRHEEARLVEVDIDEDR